MSKDKEYIDNNQGWIKLYRKITSHWIYKKPEYFHAWITILMTVNHQDKKALIQTEIIECNRGQSLLSLYSWAKLFGAKWTIQKVRTFFDLLKSDAMINTEGLQKTTRLTVCNYDSYQDRQQGTNTPITFEQQATNRELTTTKEGENDKNEKNEEKGEGNPAIFLNTFRDTWIEVYKHKFASTYKIADRDLKELTGIIEQLITHFDNNGKPITEGLMAERFKIILTKHNDPWRDEPKNFRPSIFNSQFAQIVAEIKQQGQGPAYKPIKRDPNETPGFH